MCVFGTFVLVAKFFPRRLKFFWVRTLEEGRDRASGPGRRRSRGTHSVHKGDGERAKEKEGVYLP